MNNSRRIFLSDIASGLALASVASISSARTTDERSHLPKEIRKKLEDAWFKTQTLNPNAHLLEVDFNGKNGGEISANDFYLGKTIDVDGLNLSATEVAILITG